MFSTQLAQNNSSALASGNICLAYLAPHLPSLSTTFVYEEFLAIERRGICVFPFSVRPPPVEIPGLDSLARRTQVLYGSGSALSKFVGVLKAIAALPHLTRGLSKACRWLVSDMYAVGFGRLDCWKLLYHWLTAARLGAALQHNGCNHLHVHFSSVPAQIGMYASAFTSIPFTLVGHANDIFERGLLLPQKANRAVKFLTISEFNVRYLTSIGVDEAKLAVVRCGVSLPVGRNDVCFSDKPKYRIGSLGRLIDKKGMDDFLRAVALLDNTSWDFEVSVAGDGPLRESLEMLASELGIRSRVNFEGAIDHANVAVWLGSLDVFVLACKKDANGDMDGIPVVLMEAMSQQVPVVSTHLSGIPELVIHDRTGLLAPPSNPTALATELRRLFNSAPLRARLAEAALDHVRAEFGQQVNVDRLLGHIMHGPELSARTRHGRHL